MEFHRNIFSEKVRGELKMEMTIEEFKEKLKKLPREERIKELRKIICKEWRLRA